jgi:glycerol-3-phosphate acyltransferase PlsY
MAVVGHCYPAWHGFRGGKGAATAVGALAVIGPWLLPFMLATWLVVVVLTGYVGLSTMLAAVALVPAAAWLGGSNALLVFTALLAAFVVFTHRSNIARLRAGEENRFERIRIANWFR